MAAFRAVVVGCGAMSKGWLRAIAENPDLAGRITVVGLVDLDEGRAQALADEFGLSRATIGTDLGEMLEAQKPDIVFDVVVPPARSDVVTAALAERRHVLSEKPMAASMDEARALIALAAETRAGACDRAEPPLHSGHAPHPAAARERHARRAHRRPLRLLHRRAFRRLPRRDGARAAARHGDPHLRCGRASWPARRRCAVYCHETNPRGLLVRAWRRGQRDLRVRRRRGLHLSRLVVRRGRQHQLGERAGGSSAPRARCSGTAPTASRRTSSPATEGFLRDARAGRRCPSPPTMRETHGHASVIARLRRQPSSAAPRPRPSAPTTSRASPWSSPRSKAPRPAQRVDYRSLRSIP